MLRLLVGDIIEGEVIDLGVTGEGVVKYDTLPIFVPFALPHEKVRVRINYVKKDYVFIIYLVTSSIIALLTVLNFFYIDPLHMLEGYDEATIADFGSTLGNKNIIAAFMCIFLPAAVMFFLLRKYKKHPIVYIVAAAVIGIVFKL